MRGRQRQHPGLRVPAGLGQEARVQGSGQPRGLAGQDDAAEHAAECPAGDRAQDQRERGAARRGGHGITVRGLGTRSTASRSRAGSGCRYTCVEDGCT